MTRRDVSRFDSSDAPGQVARAAQPRSPKQVPLHGVIAGARRPDLRRLDVRRLYEPRAALVEARLDGTPVRVDQEDVEVLREEWRVVDRWWTEEPVSRRYFDVVLESGRNVVVFRDEERGGWFSQRGA